MNRENLNSNRPWRRCWPVLLVGLMLSGPVPADIEAKVKGWFDRMNYANITEPGVYEGQSARYFTAGGVSMRAPITRPFHFIDVQKAK